MISNDNFPLSQGSSLVIPAFVYDRLGNVVATYNGTEPLTTAVWPGGTRAASFAPATAWVDHTKGAISIAIAAAETTGLAPGRYQLLTRVTPAGGDPVDAFGCTLDVLAAPGTSPAPGTYCDYSWLLKFGRSWLRQLQTGDDEAGFAEQLGRARSWLEDVGHAHYRVASMAMVVGAQAFGPRRSGARSTWLQEQFDANSLMVTDQVRECAARKALAYICEGQVGIGDQAAQYARLARMYHGQADTIATCLTLSLDTDGDGFADVNIDCTCTDPMDA